jgi:hypothetical protein
MLPLCECTPSDLCQAHVTGIAANARTRAMVLLVNSNSEWNLKRFQSGPR